MQTSNLRNSFLLGMTLNELAFILFFLLMFVSADALKEKAKQLDELEIALKEQTTEVDDLATELVQIKEEQDESFKKMELLESTLKYVNRLGSESSQSQLDEFFKKLQNVEGVDQAQKELNELKKANQIHRILNQAGIEKDSIVVIENLIHQVSDSEREANRLQGQIVYLQNKRKGRGKGLDHPPCWANPETGKIEYIFRISLYENKIRVVPIWPASRENDIDSIPGVEKLTKRLLTVGQFNKFAYPVYKWGKQRNCRHFVRVNDDINMSKRSFKKKLVAIENYFYKYLEK